MSLINEALKRARDASFRSGASQPMSVEQYRIANTSRTFSPGAGVGIALAGVVALVLAATGIVLFEHRSLYSARNVEHRLSPVSATPSAPRQTAINSRSSASDLSSAVAKDSAVAAVTRNAAQATNSSPAQDAAEVALVARLLDRMKAEQAAAAKPVPPPTLVLQGITSQGSFREAMINGVNVREGEDIEGARVQSIESRVVKLRFADQDLVLRMP